MKKLRNFLIIFFLIIIALTIFFIFHVPDSAEARVKQLSKSIEFYEDVEAQSRFIDFMNKYDDAEKLDIFENLSFTVLKDNRVWLVEAMNTVLPSWVDSESFNAKYLLTELKLEEKRNMRVIKNLDVLKEKMVLNTIDDLVNEIYQKGKANWQVETGDFYVVDNSLEATVKYQNGKYHLEKFKITVFEIQNAYIFEVEYDGKMLTITPSADKIEDNGAFELSEKIGFYELARLKKYVEKKYNVKSNTCYFILSDKLLDKPKDENNTTIDYLDILYNRNQIENLTDISELRYVGSMKLDFINEITEEENQNLSTAKKQATMQNIQKQILVNLFKDI